MTDILELLKLSFGIYILGIIAVLILPKKLSKISLGISGSLGSIVIFISGIKAFFTTNMAIHATLWTIPTIGALTISIDHLSALFMIITALVAIPASIFAAGHIKHDSLIYPKVNSIIFLALISSLILVITASNIFLFLVAWEIMSILIYVLVNSDNKERAGFLMLAIGEAGTLAVLIAFLILAKDTNSLGFEAIKSGAKSIGSSARWIIFLLSFFGFGIKAGLAPFNFWIPRAYTATPTSCMPLIAGATLNMGFYGIIRINADLLPISHIGSGVVILLIGAITALLGILYASIEDNIKTLLAHSSIENAGIIATALGASAIFVAANYKTAAAIAMVAALYHMLNHSIFKTLLFMGAGAVEGSTKTRSLDKLGGLIKLLPWTSVFVLVGVMSIAAMPPFNGFVSEWLTLECLLRSVELASVGVKIAFVIAGSCLALTAGLAVNCFIRFFSMGFLGMSRSANAENAHKTGKSTLITMGFMAIICFVLGVSPTYIIPTLDRVVVPITGAKASTALIPPFLHNGNHGNTLPKAFVDDFHNIGAQVGESPMSPDGFVVMHRGGKKNPVVFAMSTSYMFVALVLLLSLTFIFVWLITRKRKVSYATRWDGGINKLTPAMTYTATGFAQAVRVIFNPIFKTRVVKHKETIADNFRVSIDQKRTEMHFIDRIILYPLTEYAQKIARLLSRIHGGKINSYALYALVTLIIFLMIAMIF